MEKEDDKSRTSAVEATESGTSKESNRPNKLPSCTIVLRQFLSPLSNGHVDNPSIVINPQIKIYIDKKHVYDTNLFINMREDVNETPDHLLFDSQIDFVIPSFRSVLTFELHDYPRVSAVQYCFMEQEDVNSHIFISAVKLKVGHLTPGKVYNLILEFSGNLNPTIYEYGDILTNIRPNEVSCSQCKVCNLFNYLTTNKPTNYYNHNITSDLIVEPAPEKAEMSLVAIGKLNSCDCVKYSSINDSPPCTSCINPCCSHMYGNYISVSIRMNNFKLEKYKLLKLPQLMKPVPNKSDSKLVDDALILLQEGEIMYLKVNNALTKTLHIDALTFLQVFLCSLFILPFNPISLILVYIGILFITFSISIDSFKDPYEDYTTFCAKCLDLVNKTYKVKFTDLYKHTTCLKCLHLKNYSEINQLKIVMRFGSSSIQEFIKKKISFVVYLPLKAIDAINTFVVLSKMYGKTLGISCFLLAIILLQMKILRTTLYYLVITGIFIKYSRFKVDALEYVVNWITAFFYYMLFMSSQKVFNNRIYWHK